jgi:hypothetical protein
MSILSVHFIEISRWIGHQMGLQTWPITEDKVLLFGVGHMHSGALNVSVFVNGAFVCASYPVCVQISAPSGHLSHFPCAILSRPHAFVLPLLLEPFCQFHSLICD